MIHTILLSLVIAAPPTPPTPSNHLVKRGGCGTSVWDKLFGKNKMCQPLGQPCSANNYCEGDDTLCYVDDTSHKWFYILNKSEFSGLQGKCGARNNYGVGKVCNNQNDLNLCAAGLKCMANSVSGWRIVNTCNSGDHCERGHCQPEAKLNTMENPEGRLDCGFGGINKDGCRANGCIWSPLEAGSDLPWCYRTAPAIPRQGRTECGWMGITADECTGKGCVWSPLENGSNGTYD